MFKAQLKQVGVGVGISVREMGKGRQLEMASCVSEQPSCSPLLERKV